LARVSVATFFDLYDLVVMAEAAYNFSRGLRSRHRDDKDFLRPGKAGGPSLRARAEAMVARSREVTAPPASHETTQGWIAKFKETATETHALMRQLGMSLFDREYIDEHLVHGMPLGKLPVLEYINAQLRRLVTLSAEIRQTALRRAKALEKVKRSCAFGDRGHRGSACSVKSHERLAQTLREVDEMTVELMNGVAGWRRHLQVPLPFHVDGENLLLRMAAQYAVGSDVSLACSHLRNTSRYAAYFYASPFDAVAASGVAGPTRDLVAQWEVVVLGELALQRESAREQLTFARMGLYGCVLRLPREMLETAGMKPGCLVPIVDVGRKQLLVSCLASAYSHLSRMRQQATGALSSVAGLATFSTKALHLQYLRKWIEWVSQRRERRLCAATLRDQSEVRHAGFRWAAWMRRVAVQRQRRQRWEPFLQRTQLHLMRLYTQRWFMHHSFGNISRQVRRVLYLRYFRSFHYIVVRRRMSNGARHERYRTEGETYPAHLVALRQPASLAAGNPWLRQVAVAARTRAVAQAHVIYDEWKGREMGPALDERKARAVAYSDYLLGAFVAQAQTELSRLHARTTM
jgi:hypothetical protein